MITDNTKHNGFIGDLIYMKDQAYIIIKNPNQTYNLLCLYKFDKNDSKCFEIYSEKGWESISDLVNDLDNMFSNYKIVSKSNYGLEIK